MSKARQQLKAKLAQATELERAGDLPAAAKIFLQVLGKTPGNYLAYDRLMVIYRKQKESKKELEIIDLAIKDFEESYLTRQNNWIAQNKAAAELTRELAISLGVMDNRGLPVASDPVLQKWLKRRDLLVQRMQKQKQVKAKVRIPVRKSKTKQD